MIARVEGLSHIGVPLLDNMSVLKVPLAVTMRTLVVCQLDNGSLAAVCETGRCGRSLRLAG